METGEYRPNALPALARLEGPTGETRKDLLQLADGEQVEVVLLRYRQRRSACVSTQVGCACGCPFCATGRMGFVRHLSSAEIVAQALHVQRELAARQEQLSNVVLMGMGEPLLNYDQTVEAIRHLIDPRGLGLAPSRLTLSTVGIVPGIERLAGETAHGGAPHCPSSSPFRSTPRRTTCATSWCPSIGATRSTTYSPQRSSTPPGPGAA
jgi:23S rRNA (adenine2503-C2)-methyltransferase